MWNKPWGLPSPTSTQKANRRKQRQDEQSVAAVLKEAAAKEPIKTRSTNQKQQGQMHFNVRIRRWINLPYGPDHLVGSK